MRARQLLSTRLLPWRLVLLTTGLFLLVQTVSDRRLSTLLAELAGAGEVAANAVDNLPPTWRSSRQPRTPRCAWLFCSWAPTPDRR